MKGLNSLFNRLFKPSETAAAAPPPAGLRQRSSSGPSEPGTARRSDARAFEERLLKTARQAGSAVSGRLMVLNVEAVKARLGDRWDRYRPNIYRHIETTLARHLGPNDVFLHHGELDYAIAFADLGEAAARIKVHAIGQDILARLFGSDGELEGLSVKSAVREVDDSLHFDAASTVEQLDDALREADVITLADPEWTAVSEPPAASPDAGTTREDAAIAQLRKLIGEAESSLGRLLELPSPVRQEEMQALHVVLANSARKLDELLPAADGNGLASPAVDAVRGELADWKDRLSTLLGRVERELAAGDTQSLSPEDHIEALLSPESLEFSYLPVWNRDQEVISTYRSSCNIRSTDSFLRAEDLLGRIRHPAIDIALDRVMLKRAALLLRRMAAGEIPPHALSVPVHMATLTGFRSLHAYVHLCTAIPEAARRYLVFEILESDEPSWPTRTAGFAWHLRSYCRAILVRGSLTRREFEGYRQNRIIGLTVDLAGEQPCREGEQITQARRFIEGCRQHKLKTAFLGVDSPAVAAALIRAGVSFMSGDMVAPAIENPPGIQPLRLQFPELAGRHLH